MLNPSLGSNTLSLPVIYNSSASRKLIFGSWAVLVRVSIVVKKHHDHGNSYKGKHLIEVLAYSLRGSAHCHCGEIWWLASRHGAGEGAESSTSCRQQEVD